MQICAAGCGTGRNLVYFLRQGLDVYGVDLDTEAVSHCREGARKLSGSGTSRV
ncbi:class I SAM-dependent methyltransferase [Pedobacter sp. 22226]|uniref:class I SAM-dependent methyltransferase n=1 Tax=Pedobacter sp. 22226 TaxID=3453894 RepID=UPI003F856C69